MSTSQIVGRTLCWDAHVHGDCGGPQPPGDPEPRPLTEGPRFGQDGIRIAAGARGAVSGSLITQNLVQGENSPVRNSPTNNEHLREAAGIRLVGADAANSSVTRSNIVDNAYGVYNAAADGTSDAAAPVSALDNWWGLWSPIGGGQPTPPNDGPEVSPVTNPPYPENPVNGTPAPGGSSTVAFTPFRSGPQGDPNTGQFPVVPAPMPVADEAPTLTVKPQREDAKYRPGETVQLIADPNDDFGIRQVTFFDGAADLGSDRSPAYTAAFALPGDAPCGVRQVAATAEDSLGQTTTATATVEVLCAGPGPSPLEPPTVQLPQNLTAIRRSGETLTVQPVAKQGVARVEFFLGTRLVCRDTEAPYSCVIKPRSDEIGSQTLRAVVTDRVGLTGQDSRQVLVPRFTARAFKLEVDPKRLRGKRVRRTITAVVVPPSGVKRATACANGRVAAVVKRGRTTLLDRETKLDRRCRARVMRLTTSRSRSRKLRYKASARFGGTTVLAPARTTRRFR